MSNDNNFTLSHERANVWSHAIGIIVMVCIIPFFIIKCIQLPLWALFLYLVSVLSMFTSSTTYHKVSKEALKKKWRIIDHIAIFWVIGSTALPFVLLYKQQSNLFLICQWSFVVLGSFLKVFFTGRFRLLSSIIYSGVGLMVFSLGSDFWHAIPDLPFYLLLSGGILFLIGVFFYQNRKIPYNHFIWHLFVLFAVLIQAYAVYLVI